MGLTFYYHPFSSFCQKALLALYETGAPFERRVIDLADPDDRAELESQWPLVKFPVLRDAGRGVTVPESSLIIAYLDHHYPGSERLIPQDFDAATRVHVLDRLIDNCLLMQVTKVVTDQFREEGRHDLDGVEQAKTLIATAYAMLEADMPEQGWATPSGFTLADCAAAPALFYAGTIVPLDGYPKLSAYYRRLLGRDSVAQVFEEARPYRKLYPLPWPASYD